MSEYFIINYIINVSLKRHTAHT